MNIREIARLIEKLRSCGIDEDDILEFVQTGTMQTSYTYLCDSDYDVHSELVVVSDADRDVLATISGIICTRKFTEINNLIESLMEEPLCWNAEEINNFLIYISEG